MREYKVEDNKSVIIIVGIMLLVVGGLLFFWHSYEKKNPAAEKVIPSLANQPIKKQPQPKPSTSEEYIDPVYSNDNIPRRLRTMILTGIEYVEEFFKYIHCGNKTVDPWEQCDDGNNVDGDGCNRFCIIEGCGNGYLEAGEQCDDGNLSNGDGCSANCKSEHCGDGVVQASLGEQCDDGNVVNGDGCSVFCNLENPPVCGDGVVDAGEQCDDGNNVAGDGCSATCQKETPK